MTDCRACTRPTQLYLCTECETQLTNMLTELPQLLDELDTKIARLDHITTGTIGRNQRPDQMNIIDFDAAEQARTIRKLLQHWVETITGQLTGRIPPALHTTTAKSLAAWLTINTSHIARHPAAGQLYRDIHRLATPTGGTIHHSIDRREHHLVGPCPTITGRTPDGHPHQCGHILFADTYDTTTDCPACGQTINVEQTRRQSAAARDLHTRPDLLDVLTNIDEPITTTQLDQWIQARRLRPAGWTNNDGTITEYRIHPNSQPVYSLDKTRKLRRRDTRHTHRKTPA
jgi:hypothetical protein